VPGPAALLYGPGHRIVYGNGPFLVEFGASCLGLPAVEALLGLPARAFELMDLAYGEGRSLAAWVEIGGVHRRLVVAVRRDIETEEVYGIAIHLVAAADPGPVRGRGGFVPMIAPLGAERSPDERFGHGRSRRAS
jgi:hypothetical protein